MANINLHRIIFIFSISFLLFCIQNQITQASSINIPTGVNALNISYGVPNYPDTIMTSYNCTVSPCTVYSPASSTAPYTIVALDGFSNSIAFNSLSFSCTNGSFAHYAVSFAPYLTGAPTWFSFNIHYEIHCTGDLTTAFSTNKEVLAIVQYIPYDTRITKSSPQTLMTNITDTHFILISGFLIAILSFTIIIWLFKKQI